LIGIGVLWLTGMWWPGILILVGISMLVQVMAPRAADATPVVSKPKPTTAETRDKAEGKEEEKDPWEEDDEEETPVFMRSDPGAASKEERLPEKCPSCGGPVAENAHKVEWTGSDSAKCPFCDTPLSL